MNSKVIGIVAVVLVVVMGAFVFLRNNNSISAPSSTTVQPTQAVVSPTPESGIEASPSAAAGESTTGQVKEFTVTGSAFKFSPTSMTVNKGDTVKILFKNSGGMHNFVIDELGVETPVIQSGKEASVEFVANKAGSFEYYCSVGNHRQQGMVGTLTVK